MKPRTTSCGLFFLKKTKTAEVSSCTLNVLFIESCSFPHSAKKKKEKLSANHELYPSYIEILSSRLFLQTKLSDKEKEKGKKKMPLFSCRQNCLILLFCLERLSTELKWCCVFLLLLSICSMDDWCCCEQKSCLLHTASQLPASFIHDHL